MADDDNELGFGTAPNLQPQQARMDNTLNDQWTQNDVVLNRQAQGLPSYLPVQGFGGSDSRMSSPTVAPAAADAQTSQTSFGGSAAPSFATPGLISAPPGMGFGGSNPHQGRPYQGQGFQGIDPRSNPYFQPIQSTVDGRQSYDPVQLVLQRQRALQDTYDNKLAEAKQKDARPINMLARAGFGIMTGRKLPTREQQIKADFQKNRDLSNDDQQNLLKAVGLYQMSPQEYAKSQEALAGTWNTGAKGFNDAGVNYLARLNDANKNQNDAILNAYRAVSQDRHWQGINENQHDLNRAQLQRWLAADDLAAQKQQAALQKQRVSNDRFDATMGLKRDALNQKERLENAALGLKRDLAAHHRKFAQGNDLNPAQFYSDYAGLNGQPVAATVPQSEQQSAAKPAATDPSFGLVKADKNAPGAFGSGSSNQAPQPQPPPRTIHLGPPKRNYDASQYPPALRRAIDKFNSLSPSAQQANRAAFERAIGGYGNGG